MVLDSSALALLPGTSTSLIPAGVTASANPVAALAAAERGQAKAVAAVAKQPGVALDVAAFRKAVATAPDAAALLRDPRARKVLLTANGLGDQAAYAGLVSKALLSDTSKPGSLAGKLTDKRWLTVARTYDFANQGLAVLRRPGVLERIADGYAEVRWREELDRATPGLSNALDFRARAGGITGVDQILGDTSLRKVVTTALGIPAQIAFQPLRAQEKAITDRLDIAALTRPAFVEQFARRYLVEAAKAAAPAASGITPLFA